MELLRDYYSGKIIDLSENYTEENGDVITLDDKVMVKLNGVFCTNIFSWFGMN